MTIPHGMWLPPYDWVYCAVRDAKAALRWIHANAATYGGDPTTSFTLQGGSAGATTVIELAITGGDGVFAGDYTSELVGVDPTLDSTNLDSPALVTGLIDYWGALFAEDAMVTLDPLHRQRWSSASPPTIAFHGTNDTTVGGSGWERVGAGGSGWEPVGAGGSGWEAFLARTVRAWCLQYFLVFTSALRATLHSIVPARLPTQQVSPKSGDVLCGNLTAVGVECLKVDLVDEGHGCWDANVTLDDGTIQSIYDYAFEWMALQCSWELL